MEAVFVVLMALVMLAVGVFALVAMRRLSLLTRTDRRTQEKR